MYTLKQWDSVCCQLSKNHNNFIKAESLHENDMEMFTLLKHDVECKSYNALEVARVEAKYGIVSTFFIHSYFLYNESDIENFKDILALGHEIGYHYDVLDLNGGDWNLAKKQFQDDILLFKEKLNVNVRSICPHGNPTIKRNGWNSNKDFFKSEEIQGLYPLLIDVVNDFDKIENGVYISDAGYQLNLISDIKYNDSYQSLDQLISIESMISLKNNKLISVHPHRIEGTVITLLLRKSTFFIFRFIYKKLSKSNALKQLLSPLFKLAKRF